MKIITGLPRGLMHASAFGLKCFVEFIYRTDEVLRYSTESYAHLPPVCAWYVADEPDETAEKEAARVNDALHGLDTQHPTFLVSCRPDVFARQQQFCDVFSCDPYAGGETKPSVELTIDWLRKAQSATEGRKPLVLDRVVDAEFAMPELDRVRSVKLPIAPMVERKDKDGHVVKDKSGKPILDIAGQAQEKVGFVKHTFQPWEPIAYRW